MDCSAERERIVDEYERRDREVSEAYYSMTQPANMLMHFQTVRACTNLLGDAGLLPLSGRRILDVGCGTGGWLLQFAQCDADPALMSGIDLSRDRIDRAKRRLPQADLRTGCASTLPWPDGHFDIVTQFEAFSSILSDEMKRDLAREMVRVLKPGGAILWLDFRVSKRSNQHVKAIREAEIRSLFSGCLVRTSSVLLAPPLARVLAPHYWTACELLHLLPLVRTHYAALVLPPQR